MTDFKRPNTEDKMAALRAIIYFFTISFDFKNIF